ncbi:MULTISPECIES: hypothetical protein [Microbacterium]|uniref:hypothetical protein n=1 Tax=Microbacterium TaxID=33882 RepID=UPI00126A3486|nr:hypothetical protein [Microbacterium profundi]
MSTTTVARTKTPLWAKVLLIVLILLLIGVAGLGGVMLGKVLGATEERSTQVIRSITREEQIILATAGMTDVKTESDAQEFFGLFDIPFTDRTMLMKYEYDAKFGIEGSDVSIEPIGDDTYRVSIPEFVFLGYDNPDFSIADEKNGILSWATPAIDKNEVVKSILTDEAVAAHIEGMRPVLEEQAKSFYTNIITAIDPGVTLQFTYANGKEPE